MNIWWTFDWNSHSPHFNLHQHTHKHTKSLACSNGKSHHHYMNYFCFHLHSLHSIMNCLHMLTLEKLSLSCTSCCQPMSMKSTTLPSILYSPATIVMSILLIITSLCHTTLTLWLSTLRLYSFFIFFLHWIHLCYIESSPCNQ